MSENVKQTLTSEQTLTILKVVRIAAKDLELSKDELSLILKGSKGILEAWFESEMEIDLNAHPALRETMSHFLGVYRSLCSMFSNGRDRREWLNSKHPIFGPSPLDYLKEDLAGLISIRKYLDYARERGA